MLAIVSKGISFVFLFDVSANFTLWCFLLLNVLCFKHKLDSKCPDLSVSDKEWTIPLWCHSVLQNGSAKYMVISKYKTINVWVFFW